MTQGHPPKSKQSQLRNLVNSHFLDDRWFDLHFLDNDFHFLDSRCGWPDKKAATARQAVGIGRRSQ
jgi:hypothetical protein